MMFQLDLFNINDSIRPLISQAVRDRYAEEVSSKPFFNAFEDRRTIAIIAEMLQASSFTWSNSIEGSEYWSEVSERLQLISESIQEPTSDSTRFHPVFTITRNPQPQ
jgi:hypothetical protein